MGPSSSLLVRLYAADLHEMYSKTSMTSLTVTRVQYESRRMLVFIVVVLDVHESRLTSYWSLASKSRLMLGKGPSATR